MDEAEKLVGGQSGIKDHGGLLNSEDKVHKSQVLHAILLNVVKLESEPFKMLENNDGRGVECWRLMHKRWSRTSPMTSIDVLEKIRSIPRAKTAEEVAPKLQELMTLVQEWEKLRSTTGAQVKYDDVLLKSDFFKIIPEAWATKFKVDADLDYMYCSSEAVMEKLELYMRTYTSTHAPMDLGGVDQQRSKETTKED